MLFVISLIKKDSNFINLLVIFIILLETLYYKNFNDTKFLIEFIIICFLVF